MIPMLGEEAEFVRAPDGGGAGGGDGGGRRYLTIMQEQMKERERTIAQMAKGINDSKAAK